MVLDIGLPGLDGFSVCSRIRETSNTHILIASAKTDKENTLKGLQIGADDYISKPFDVDILIAKINGIFKRKYAREEIICNNLKLNTVTQTLTVHIKWLREKTEKKSKETGAHHNSVGNRIQI